MRDKTDILPKKKKKGKPQMGTTRGYPNHLLPLPPFSPAMASSSLDVSSVNDHFAITFLVLPSSLTLPLIVSLSLVSPLLNHPISLH